MSQSEVLNGVLWTEKYRPRKLADVGLDPATRTLLQQYIAAGEIPHMMLVGPPGTGKTTLSQILVDELDCRVLLLNASKERGIDVVREKIAPFVTGMMAARWRIVWLDEADAMTADAQTSLRNLMETYADGARFILTANYGHRIIAPIRDRCQVLTMGLPPMEERFRVLSAVFQAEGIVAEPKTVLSYVNRYPGMRQMLYAAQRAYLSSGAMVLPEAAQSTDGINAVEMLDALNKRNWTTFRRMTTVGDFDPLQTLRELFWAIPDEHPRAGFLRHILGRGVHEMGFTPDPVVLFLGVLAEAMEGLK